MLQNEYLLAKIGADPAENELQKDPKTGPLKDVNGDINTDFGNQLLPGKRLHDSANHCQ